MLLLYDLFYKSIPYEAVCSEAPEKQFTWYIFTWMKFRIRCSGKGASCLISIVNYEIDSNNILFCFWECEWREDLSISARWTPINRLISSEFSEIGDMSDWLHRSRSNYVIMPCNFSGRRRKIYPYRAILYVVRKGDAYVKRQMSGLHVRSCHQTSTYIILKLIR